MVYTFTKMDDVDRPAWAAQHPDTTVVGFGRSKLRAIRHLEAGKINRQEAIEALIIPVPLEYPVTA